MSDLRPWRGQAYLDELRPAPGWKVELALFATYSLDLSAVGAALLALCGRSDGNGSGSVADFAEAVDTLRGSTRFMVQRGRIARPSRLPTLAGVLDQFVVEEPYDEEHRSWHPKAALVRYSRGRERAWRIWLGSRNLTRSSDLEAGILIETAGGRSKGARAVLGIGDVARLLTTRSGLTGHDVAAIASELSAARWIFPEGVEITRIDYSDDGIPMRPVPVQQKLDSVTVVSPFLDATFLRDVGGWGSNDTRRTLVSTRQALAAVAQSRNSPLARFGRLLALDAPEPPFDATEQTMDTLSGPTLPAEDAEPQMPSLHAKLFCFEYRGSATLLVGSANATSRAWSGRNAELLAELKGGAAITTGLAHLVGSASPMTIAELKDAKLAEPRPRDELERLRRRLVAAWSPKLMRDGLTFAVEVVGSGPHLPTGVGLRVGLASTELAEWPPGSLRVDLGGVPASRHTDLLRCELRMEGAAIGWMQRAPVTPPLDADRDAVALASLLGFGAFQTWMRQLLSGDTIQSDGGRWDQHTSGDPKLNIFDDLEALTLEDIVGSWGADKVRFRRADAQFDRYCDALLGQEGLLTDPEKIALNELQAIWHLARERLPA